MIDIEQVKKLTLDNKKTIFENKKQQISSIIFDRASRGLDYITLSGKETFHSMSNEEIDCIIRYFQSKGFNVDKRGESITGDNRIISNILIRWS